MSTGNTSRRGLYLPESLDKWFIEHGKETDVKVNALMLKALNQYKDEESAGVIRKAHDFEREVLNVLRRNGIIE